MVRTIKRLNLNQEVVDRIPVSEVSFKLKIKIHSFILLLTVNWLEWKLSLI